MQLELFGHIDNRLYWVHKSEPIAILGTVADLEAWLHFKRSIHKIADFRQVACTDTDLKDFRIVLFPASAELVKHDVVFSRGSHRILTPRKAESRENLHIDI